MRRIHGPGRVRSGWVPSGGAETRWLQAAVLGALLAAGCARSPSRSTPTSGATPAPVPWTDAPVGYRPPDVADALQRIAARCPGVDTTRVVTECSEYPCLVCYPTDLGAREETLHDCSVWPFGAHLLLGTADAPDGARVSYSFYVVAPEAIESERLEHREEQVAAKAVADWRR